MPIRDRLAEKAASFKGQKSGLPLDSYGIDSAELCQNFFLKNGQLTKSPGCEVFTTILTNEPLATGGVLSLHRFKFYLFGQRATSMALLYKDQNGDIQESTMAAGYITLSRRLFSTSWRDRIVFTNARDALHVLVSETSASGGLLGLDAPADPLQASWFDTATAGNVDNENHYYLLTLYDDKTNTESPACGAQVSADGLVEWSPNGFLGPRPANINPGAAKTVKITYANLAAYLVAIQNSTDPYYRATHFIIYRAGAKINGLYDSFFRVPLVNASSSMNGQVFISIDNFRAEGYDFIDNTSDANLPAVSLPENNSPPPTPARMKRALDYARGQGYTTETWALADYSGFRHMRFFRDQLFGIGAKSFGMNVLNLEVSFGNATTTKLTGRVTNFRDLLHGSEVYQPDYWPYRWEVGRGDGQEAIGLGVLGDVALLCFKEGSTYYLSGSSPESFVVRVMDSRLGCVNEGTIQETPIGVITLDRSGFVLWNKIGQGTRISEEIHDVIQSILFQYSATFYSSYDRRDNLYRCSVVVPGGQTPNLTCVLDLGTMQWTVESGGEGLCRLTDRPLERVDFTTSSVTLSDDDTELLDLVGSNTNGRLLDFTNAEAVEIQGAAIESIWTSGTINFGDDQHKKRMNWVYLRAKSNSGWKVNIEIIPDYDESRKYVVEDWDVVSSQSQWYSSDIATDGSLLWDDGTGELGGRWASAGPTRQVSKIPVKCIGYTFQIRIIHREADTSRWGFAIESVSAEGVRLGR